MNGLHLKPHLFRLYLEISAGKVELLRKKLHEQTTVVNMLHLGPRAFGEIGGEVVQSTAFIFQKAISNYVGTYVRLVEYLSEEEKKLAFNKCRRFCLKQEEYEKVPGMLYAYWLSEKVIDSFIKLKNINDYADARVGLQTSDNNRFLRYWHEINYLEIGFACKSCKESQISKKKWFPYNKGGSFRKWYGNNDYLVNWENNGKEIREYNNYLNSSRASNIGIANTEYYFMEGMTWSALASGTISVRYVPNGYIFDSKGSSCFSRNQKDTFLILGYLNSKVAMKFLDVIAPTLDFGPGAISRVPFKKIESSLYLEKFIKKSD